MKGIKFKEERSRNGRYQLNKNGSKSCNFLLVDLKCLKDSWSLAQSLLEDYPKLIVQNSSRDSRHSTHCAPFSFLTHYQEQDLEIFLGFQAFRILLHASFSGFSQQTFMWIAPSPICICRYWPLRSNSKSLVIQIPINIQYELSTSSSTSFHRPRVTYVSSSCAKPNIRKKLLIFRSSKMKTAIVINISGKDAAKNIHKDMEPFPNSLKFIPKKPAVNVNGR